MENKLLATPHTSSVATPQYPYRLLHNLPMVRNVTREIFFPSNFPTYLALSSAERGPHTFKYLGSMNRTSWIGRCIPLWRAGSQRFLPCRIMCVSLEWIDEKFYIIPCMG